jgi:hypothetical protein
MNSELGENSELGTRIITFNFRKTKLYEQSKRNFVIRVDHIIIKNIMILALIKLIFIIKVDVKA